MASYGAQFQKNKKTVAERNLQTYGEYTCEVCKKAPLVKGTGTFIDHVYTKAGGRLMTIDHIVPLSKGGKNGLYNLQVCCISCNLKMGAK